MMRSKAPLRRETAEHGRSMAEEARQILRESLFGSGVPAQAGSAIHALFKPFGGVELNIPPRMPDREPPDFRGPGGDQSDP